MTRRIKTSGALRDEQVFPPDTPGRAAAGIEGRRVGGEPLTEAEHFFTCAECGQAVDMRDLGQVLHHEQPGHGPLPADG